MSTNTLRAESRFYSRRVRGAAENGKSQLSQNHPVVERVQTACLRPIVQRLRAPELLALRVRYGMYFRRETYRDFEDDTVIAAAVASRANRFDSAVSVYETSGSKRSRLIRRP